MLKKRISPDRSASLIQISFFYLPEIYFMATDDLDYRQVKSETTRRLRDGLCSPLLCTQ